MTIFFYAGRQNLFCVCNGLASTACVHAARRKRHARTGKEKATVGGAGSIGAAQRRSLDGMVAASSE